ncbi:hypothetical protein HDU89_007442 [Geranomyces variabilis]|nr:hypothetical protein HDU89_007442 [Geranomyces variabilis]
MAYPSSSGSVIVSRRTASGHFLPALNSPQDVTVLNSSTSGSQNVVFFSRPVAAGSGSTTSIQAASQSLIYSGYYGLAPTSPNLVPQHTLHGTATGNLLDGSMSRAAGNGQILSGNDGARDTQLRRAHGALLSIAWVILAPVAILVARFGKQALGIWWFRIHMALFLAVVACTYTGFALIYTVVKENSNAHYNYQLSGIHVIFGLIIIIVTAPQALLGFVINYLWSAERTSIPWWDRLHWWSGRFLFLVAMINVPFGIALYHKDVGNSVVWAFTVFGVLSGVAVVAAVLLIANTKR